MKSPFITAVLIIMFAIGGTLVTRAMAFHGDGDRRSGNCAERVGTHRSDRMERMTRALDLTEDQRQQIQSILAAAREANRPIREKLHDNRKAMRAAATGETIDRDKVRALAADNANLKADLLISRVETRKQISAVLTPEQQQQLEKLRSQRGKHHGRHHKHQHGPGPGSSEPADS
jgi:Spy/CpxP family protein refolding chaperone